MFIYGWSYHNLCLSRNTKRIFSPLLEIPWPVLGFLFSSPQVPHVCITFEKEKAKSYMCTILEGHCLSCWSMLGLGVMVHFKYLGPSTPWLPSSQAQPTGHAQLTTGSQPRKWWKLEPFLLWPCWLLTRSGIWATPQGLGRLGTYGQKTHGCCLGLPETKTWWSFRKNILKSKG